MKKEITVQLFEINENVSFQYLSEKIKELSTRKDIANLRFKYCRDEDNDQSLYICGTRLETDIEYEIRLKNKSQNKELQRKFDMMMLERLKSEYPEEFLK